MEKNNISTKVFTALGLTLIGILIITITKFQLTKRSQEKVIAEVIEEIDPSKKEAANQKNIGIPFIDVGEARKKLYTVFVDIRPKEVYLEDHIRDSKHITEFKPKDHSLATSITLISSGDADDQSNEDLLRLVKEMPSQFETQVLSGGFPAWKSAGIVTIQKPDLTNPADMLKIQEVEPRDVNALYNTQEKYIIVDTRSVAAFKKSHAPEAINIPYSELEKRRREIRPLIPIYTYGKDTNDSYRSAIVLYNIGFVNVHAINGGLEAWENYDYPLEPRDDTPPEEIPSNPET